MSLSSTALHLLRDHSCLASKVTFCRVPLPKSGGGRQHNDICATEPWLTTVSFGENVSSTPFGPLISPAIRKTVRSQSHLSRKRWTARCGLWRCSENFGRRAEYPEGPFGGRHLSGRTSPTLSMDRRLRSSIVVVISEQQSVLTAPLVKITSPGRSGRPANVSC
jgi:hypothetical protein